MEDTGSHNHPTEQMVRTKAIFKVGTFPRLAYIYQRGVTPPNGRPNPRKHGRISPGIVLGLQMNQKSSLLRQN